VCERERDREREIYSVKQRGAYLQHSFKICHEKMLPGVLQKFPASTWVCKGTITGQGKNSKQGVQGWTKTKYVNVMFQLKNIIYDV
jgi:hypothetical protein